MPYQLALITEAGVIVRNNLLKFLYGLAAVLNGNRLILDGSFQYINPLYLFFLKLILIVNHLLL